jgi:CubicO group peptidase (beta-lactamase class C family)
MTRSILVRLALAAALILPAPLSLPGHVAAAQPRAPAEATASDQGVEERLRSYMKARRDLGHFNGTVLVMQAGRTLISEGTGWAVFEHAVPATSATRYAVASITKQFTAAAILQLRDRGLIEVDDPLCKHLDPCPEAWRPITIRHLLNHTSGVLDYEEPRGLGDPEYISFVTRPDHLETAVKEAAAAPLEFVPGSKFHYSNTGYILLSKVISKVSGQPFGEYIEEHVLRPAGMAESVIFTREIIPQLARGYRMKRVSLRLIAQGQDLNDPALVEPHVLGDMSGEHGDANLITTAQDLARWVAALGSGKIVGARSLQEMTTPALENYGYGVEIGARFGTRHISHSGGLAGYVSLLDSYPEKDLVVVVLSNLEGTRLGAVARDLAAIALGVPYGLPTRHAIVDLPAAELQKWVGEYAVAGGTIAVALKGEALELRAPDGSAGPLLAESPDRFYLPRLGGDWVEGTVSFSRAGPRRKPAVRVAYRGAVLSGEMR